MSQLTPFKSQSFLARLLIPLFVLGGLLGCAAVGPDYTSPSLPATDTWRTDLTGGVTAEAADPHTLARWWLTLNDPLLSSLIERAVTSNLDVQDARARVREARARRGVSQSDLFPTLDASGSAQTFRSSADSGSGKEDDLYSVGFDAGWEIDVFGGIRRSIEAAEADLQSRQEALRDVLVSLLAEVALNYTETRTFQARLAVAQANLDAQQETYDLTRWRYQAGLNTDLAVEQAKYNLENTRSQIPSLRAGLEAAKNRLAVLLGAQPGAMHAELAERQAIPITPLDVAVGVPADALRRRPDVRQAEREVAAQTARVGVAMADLYPRLSLLGSIGLEALSTGSLFETGSRTYSMGPTITWPIFHAGAIRKNIEVQSALQEQALIQYEGTILTALEEVENALVAYAEEQRRRQALREATQASQNAVLLAQNQYQAGLSDFSEVLDAQRSLLTFQDQLASSNGAVTSNLISLYKTLGGGWTSLKQ